MTRQEDGTEMANAQEQVPLTRGVILYIDGDADWADSMVKHNERAQAWTLIDGRGLSLNELTQSLHAALADNIQVHVITSSETVPVNFDMGPTQVRHQVVATLGLGPEVVVTVSFGETLKRSNSDLAQVLGGED